MHLKIAKLTIPFLMGYFLYALIEILARGYTHWTMTLTGGAVFLMMCVAFRNAPPMPRQFLYLFGAVIITSFELAVGVIVNLYLGWDVWDYSHLPLNFHGQICLLHSTFWYFTSIPAKALYDLLEPKLNALAV